MPRDAVRSGGRPRGGALELGGLRGVLRAPEARDRGRHVRPGTGPVRLARVGREARALAHGGRDRHRAARRPRPGVLRPRHLPRLPLCRDRRPHSHPGRIGLGRPEDRPGGGVGPGPRRRADPDVAVGLRVPWWHALRRGGSAVERARGAYGRRAGRLAGGPCDRTAEYGNSPGPARGRSYRQGDGLRLVAAGRRAPPPRRRAAFPESRYPGPPDPADPGGLPRRVAVRREWPLGAPALCRGRQVPGLRPRFSLWAGPRPPRRPHGAH